MHMFPSFSVWRETPFSAYAGAVQLFPVRTMVVHVLAQGTHPTPFLFSKWDLWHGCCNAKRKMPDAFRAVHTIDNQSQTLNTTKCTKVVG